MYTMIYAHKYYLDLLDPPLGACEGVWPYQILDFELVAPRIVRK